MPVHKKQDLPATNGTKVTNQCVAGTGNKDTDSSSPPTTSEDSERNNTTTSSSVSPILQATSTPPAADNTNNNAAPEILDANHRAENENDVNMETTLNSEPEKMERESSMIEALSIALTRAAAIGGTDAASSEMTETVRSQNTVQTEQMSTDIRQRFRELTMEFRSPTIEIENPSRVEPTAQAQRNQANAFKTGNHMSRRKLRKMAPNAQNSIRPRMIQRQRNPAIPTNRPISSVLAQVQDHVEEPAPLPVQPAPTVVQSNSLSKRLTFAQALKENITPDLANAITCENQDQDSSKPKSKKRAKKNTPVAGDEDKYYFDESFDDRQMWNLGFAKCSRNHYYLVNKKFTCIICGDQVIMNMPPDF